MKIVAIHQVLNDSDDDDFDDLDDLDDSEQTFFILLSLRGNRHPEFEEMYHQDQIQVGYIPQSDDVLYVVVDDGGGEDDDEDDMYLMMMMMIFGRYDAATEDRQIVWKKMIINFIER